MKLTKQDIDKVRHGAHPFDAQYWGDYNAQSDKHSHQYQPKHLTISSLLLSDFFQKNPLPRENIISPRAEWIIF